MRVWGFDTEFLDHTFCDFTVCILDGFKGKVLAVFLDEQLSCLLQFLDICLWGGVDDGFDGFLKAGVAFLGFEKPDAGEEEFAVKFEDLKEFRGNVGTDDVLDTDAGRFFFALLEELGHGSALLFGDGGVFLFYHAEAADGELELDFDLGLVWVSREASRSGLKLTYYN